MNKLLKIPLKQLLIRAIDGSATELEFGELSRIFLAVARQLIMRKISAGKLNLYHFGLSERDLAYDCIADIFQRNNENQLIRLKKYFDRQNIGVKNFSDLYLLSSIRALVFQIVEDNIFRIYREYDPVYSNILNNLKIAVNKSTEFRITTLFGEQYLSLAAGEECEYFPTMSDEELKTVISVILSNEIRMPRIIEKLAEVLKDKVKERKKIRLATLASEIKIGFELLNRPLQKDNIQVDDFIYKNDIHLIIKDSCDEILKEMRIRYVESKKVDNKTFTNYLNAIKEVFTDEFINHIDGEKSFFEYLKLSDSSLTKDKYVREHRVIFEYLVKLTRKRIIKKYKAM